MLGYASRPSARGWGFQTSLLYRVGVGSVDGSTVKDRGLDVMAAAYKRLRLGNTALFPSLGGFAGFFPTKVLDSRSRSVIGLRASLPIVIKVSAGKRLILEPTFQFGDHGLDRYEHYNFLGLDLRLNF